MGATESPRQSDGVELILMDNVSKVEIAHLDANGNSHPDWPPPNAPSNTGKLLPRMIEMKISFQDETEVGLIISRGIQQLTMSLNRKESHYCPRLYWYLR